MTKSAYKIRIVADTEEDIFIDVDAIKNANFLTIHELIVDEFNLNKMEIASFYL